MIAPGGDPEGWRGRDRRGVKPCRLFPRFRVAVDDLAGLGLRWREDRDGLRLADLFDIVPFDSVVLRPAGVKLDGSSQRGASAGPVKTVAYQFADDIAGDFAQ
jgi:hypothetical protein